MRTALALIVATSALAATAAPALAQGPGRGDRFDDRPRGSYEQSCRNINVRRGEITAECRNRRDRWVWSTASADCRNMENHDGRLVCVSGGGRPGGPGGPGNGGGRADAVIFEHAGYGGRAYEVRGDMPDFVQIGFNDKASSIQIRRGEWELCDDAYYRGRCWRVSGDMGVFPRDMNDRISSIRRIR
jgi:hypothetical protein